MGLGSALRSTGDLKGAIAEYREAVRLNPQFSYAHYNLGSALLVHGDQAEAAKEFAEAERLNPKLKKPENRPRPTHP